MFKELDGFAVWSEKVNGHRYTAYFQFVGEDFTRVDLVAERPFMKGSHVNPFQTIGVQAFTKRNPKDTPNRVQAMKEAMRKACGVGEKDAPLLFPYVYSAFRYFLRKLEPIIAGVDFAVEGEDVTVIAEFGPSPLEEAILEVHKVNVIREFYGDQNG